LKFSDSPADYSDGQPELSEECRFQEVLNTRELDKGKLAERAGRKAAGLSPRGYGSRVAGQGSHTFRSLIERKAIGKSLFRSCPSPIQTILMPNHALVSGRREAGKMIRELSNNEVKALHYELVMKDIIAAAEKLPPFPDIAWKVTSLIKREAPMTDIEDVIKYDQVIAARILRLAQTAYYGRRSEIRSLKDAILLLGNKRLL